MAVVLELLLMLFRFADKQMRLVRLKAARAQLEEKCMKALERHKQRDKLVLKIMILINVKVVQF